MTKIAAKVRDSFNKEYQKLSDKERANYKTEAENLEAECNKSLLAFAQKRNLAVNRIREYEEAIRENIIIESFYANPDDPQKVYPIALYLVSQIDKLLLDGIYDSTPEEEVYQHIVTNSGTTAIESEREELLEYFRFIIKYMRIGHESESEDDELQ